MNQPCFPAGTPILTPLGSIPIEHLKPGDVVFSRPENDVHAPVELQEVEQVYARQSEVYELTVGGRTINTTGEHPFWVKGNGWVAAAELEQGDEFSTHTGEWIPLEEIRYTGETVTVYNFRVADTHTYFVGDPSWRFSVWVHNTHAGSVTLPTPKAGIYEFPDQMADKIYVGQSSNIPKRLKVHEADGRLKRGTETIQEILGGKTAREIAEHRRIQEITGGVPARLSDEVANKIDPIGPNREHLLDELFDHF